jgi:hypothetical protein
VPPFVVGRCCLQPVVVRPVRPFDEQPDHRFPKGVGVCLLVPIDEKLTELDRLRPRERVGAVLGDGNGCLPFTFFCEKTSVPETEVSRRRIVSVEDGPEFRLLVDAVQQFDVATQPGGFGEAVE